MGGPLHKPEKEYGKGDSPHGQVEDEENGYIVGRSSYTGCSTYFRMSH